MKVSAHLPKTTIRPVQGWAPLELKELWVYRELLYFLVWRDLKVRYKQTVLGAAWAVIQPLASMLIFSIFFGRLAGMESDGAPYPLFAFTALVPWMYFANGVTQASNSLVDNERIISKVYFPRLLMPAAAVLSGLVDFAIAFTVLVGFLFWYGQAPSLALLAVPFLILLAATTALAVGLWLSALNVQFRDVRYVIPFLIQVWLFATPVVYPSSLVPEGWRTLYGINPMVGVVEGFRWALLGQADAPGPLLLVSALTVAGLLIAGLYYFQRTEQTFADVV